MYKDYKINRNIIFKLCVYTYINFKKFRTKFSDKVFADKINLDDFLPLFRTNCLRISDVIV